MNKFHETNFLQRKINKLFQQPQLAFEITLRSLCVILLMLNRLGYEVFGVLLPPEYRTPFVLFAQTLLLLSVSTIALTPAIRDLRDMLAYEWFWALVWNVAYFTKSPWYESNWLPLQLIINWITILAALRIVWFTSSAAGSLRTDWPLFGIIGFIMRKKHLPKVKPTWQSGLLVWALIWAAYPLAWITTPYAIDLIRIWLFVFGTIAICVFGKKIAIAVREHVSQAIQTQTALQAILPEVERLKTALIKAASQHPPVRTRDEALLLMQQWLSEEERTVLDAMRRTHPKMIPLLVDCMLNLAGNIPRPALGLVPPPKQT